VCIRAPCRYFGIVEIQEVADAGPTLQQQRQALIQQMLLALLLYVIPDSAPVAAPACAWQPERGAGRADAGGVGAQQTAVAAPAASQDPPEPAGVLPGLVSRTFSSSLQLRTPWTCPRVSAAALEQLQRLGSITPGLTPQDSTIESTALSVASPAGQEQGQQQEEGSSHQASSPTEEASWGPWLLARVLPGVVQQLRPVLTAQHQHDIARERGAAGEG
jgi:hypothetical protein